MPRKRPSKPKPIKQPPIPAALLPQTPPNEQPLLIQLAQEELAFQAGADPEDRPQIPQPPPDRALLTSVAEDIRQVLEELARRKVEALNLYEPLPLQDGFHRSHAPERLLRGSNRSGKTLGAAVETARAVVGVDPFDKYPRRDGRLFATAFDGKQVGEVLYRKLFRPNAFRIIKTRRDGWRAYRPWLESDVAIKADSRPAPPLIPARLVREVAWDKKAANIPELVRLATGWEINFFSSRAKPPQGSDVDIAWFDEEIEDEEWYPEVAARLVDRNGKFYWSATPQAGTEQLYELSCLAADQTTQERPRVEEFHLLLEHNPHLGEAQKRLLEEKFSNPETYRVRIKGEFAIVSLRIYGEFDDRAHGCDPFVIPPDWTTYAAVDPGHQYCAVLFLVVPPPGVYKLRRRVFVYDELYIPRCTAAVFGEQMRHKAAERVFRAFLIDGHAGRITEMGSGKSVEEQYAEALKRNGVASEQTGHGFQWGYDDLDGGISAVRDWLSPGDQAEPVLQYFRGRVPNFKREMERYHFKRVSGQMTSKPVKKDDHLCDDLRYLASHGCPYARPKKSKPRKSYAMEAVKAKARRKRDSDGSGGYTRLGPGQPGG